MPPLAEITRMRQVSDALQQEEIDLASAKERLRSVERACDFREAVLYLEVVASGQAKNTEERKTLTQQSANADPQMRDLIDAEHKWRIQVSTFEAKVNSLTREFRMCLTVIAYEEARLRALAAGVEVR